MFGICPVIVGQDGVPKGLNSDGTKTERPVFSESDNPFQKIEKGEVSPPVSPEEADEIRRQEGEEVRRNLEQALSNYREIQDGQSESRVRNLDRRILENENLLQRNREALTNYQERVRKAKLDYIRELLALKGSYKGKRIRREVFEEQLRDLAAEYEFRIGQLDHDVDYYRNESSSSELRLGDLKEQNRIYQMASRRTRAIEKKKLPLTRLERLHRQLASGQTFELQDIWDGSDWRFFQIR
jgi:hypothetical protein